MTLRGHASPEAIEGAKKAALYVEDESRGLFYGLLRDSVRTEDLERASGDDGRTLAKMAIGAGEVHMRLRTLAALGHLDMAGALRIHALLLGQLPTPYRPVPAGPIPAPSPLPRTLQEQAEAEAAHASAAAAAYLALADGAVSEDEMEAIERLWMREDEEREEARGALRALARRGEVERICSWRAKR